MEYAPPSKAEGGRPASSATAPPLGVYVHVPFCAAICNYCNFNRSLLDSSKKVRYVAAAIAETLGHAREMSGESVVDTVYFGGGTPSLLEPAEVSDLLAAIRHNYQLAPDAEVTLEANPEGVTEQRLAGFKAAGVNRLSVGVQSLRNTELVRLSRLHDAARAIRAIEEARQAGFDNLSLDLMMWLPGQTTDEWFESVERAVSLAPEHLSMYMLEVYPNAPLRDLMARAAWSQAPDDDVATMYEGALDRVAAAGYAQYEISNVCQPGRWSRHNMKYWEDGQWLGVGPGAHSTLRGQRWRNVAAIDEYLALVEAGRSPKVDVHTSSPDERLSDALFTGLRLVQGLDPEVVGARYGVDLDARYGAALRPYADAGLLQLSPRQWRLTRRGFLLAHEVMTVFV